MVIKKMEGRKVKIHPGGNLYNSLTINEHRYVLWKTTDGEYKLSLYHGSLFMSINYRSYEIGEEAEIIFFFDGDAQPGELSVSSKDEMELMKQLLSSHEEN